jgi:hypothetical protein
VLLVKEGNSKPALSTDSSRFKADITLARSEADKFLMKFGRCVKCGSKKYADKLHTCPPAEEIAERKAKRVQGMISSMEKGQHPNGSPSKSAKAGSK